MLKFQQVMDMNFLFLLYTPGKLKEIPNNHKNNIFLYSSFSPIRQFFFIAFPRRSQNCEITSVTALAVDLLSILSPSHSLFFYSIFIVISFSINWQRGNGREILLPPSRFTHLCQFHMKRRWILANIFRFCALAKKKNVFLLRNLNLNFLQGFFFV